MSSSLDDPFVFVNGCLDIVLPVLQKLIHVVGYNLAVFSIQ